MTPQTPDPRATAVAVVEKLEKLHGFYCRGDAEHTVTARNEGYEAISAALADAKREAREEIAEALTGKLDHEAPEMFNRREAFAWANGWNSAVEALRLRAQEHPRG